jgi:hypothetical protein
VSDDFEEKNKACYQGRTSHRKVATKIIPRKLVQAAAEQLEDDAAASRAEINAKVS